MAATNQCEQHVSLPRRKNSSTPSRCCAIVVHQAARRKWIAAREYFSPKPTRRRVSASSFLDKRRLCIPTVASGRVDSVRFAIFMSVPICRKCAALTLRSRSLALPPLHLPVCYCYVLWKSKQASQRVTV